MTVVVLIFLVALVVILMRNTELVGQLRESVTQTETMTSQRGEMEMRIATLGDEVVRLRSILEQSEVERSAAEQTIVLKEGEIASLLDDVGALKKIRDALAVEKASLDEQLAAVKEEREQLSEEKTALLATQQDLENQLSSLEQDRIALQATRASLQTEVAGLIAARQQLTEEKSELAQELAGATSAREQLSEEKTALSHTVGHAIETFCLNTKNREDLTHGHSIALGMIIEGYLSTIKLNFDTKLNSEINRFLLLNFEKNIFSVKEVDEIIKLMSFDKKNKDGQINFVLLKEIGKPMVDQKVDTNTIKKSFKYLNDFS